jgi:quinol-cytochrome oxidoreductase complex cytochrome b subunit/cytochrome c551/c552
VAKEPNPGRLSALKDALDQRTGYRALLRAAGDEAVHGGASFAYVFGSALVFTFVIQVLTGISLATVYAPTVTDAWGSVYTIQHEMTLGWLVRGLHHFGSSAMIVLCVLHMTQVFLYGAYRKPREINWITGMVMLLLVLAFGLTGYLLPWDQKGYWATQVATRIMGGTPGGESLQLLLQGGAEYGTLTLTRFYAIHVFILPISLTLLIVGHIALFRRHGVTASPKKSEEEVQNKVDTFWPLQVLYDLVAAAVVLGALVALVLAVGVSLEAPADPASGYEARPEWYFLFLFQLLKYFEGPMTLVGTVVIPGLAVGFLVALPFLDRMSGAPRRRPPMRLMVPFFGVFLGAGALTAVALNYDATSESYHAGRAVAVEEAERANRLAAMGGLDGMGRIVLYEGHRLFKDKGCVSCHAKGSEKPAPLLAGYGGAERIARFLKNPDHEDFFGLTPLKEAMEPVEVDDDTMDGLVAYMLHLGGRADGLAADAEEVAAGKVAFEAQECTTCHNDPSWSTNHEDYDATAEGPDLAGYQSFEWTRALLRDVHAPQLFGGAVAVKDREDMMPAYPDLSDDELRLLVRWLRAGAPEAD